jgi:hypothetical protein
MLAIFPSIAGLQEGDFFHAECENGARAICLVTSVGGANLEARVITTQYDLAFDMKTGLGNSAAGDYPCKVNSVRPVPKHVSDAFHDIDRKYRLQNAPQGSRLLPHEIEALLFAGKHYYEVHQHCA